MPMAGVLSPVFTHRERTKSTILAREKSVSDQNLL